MKRLEWGGGGGGDLHMGVYFCSDTIWCCRVCDLSLRVSAACVTGYRALVKWWGNTVRGAQRAAITALDTTSHVSGDVAPIHKVLDKCLKRLLRCL